MDKGSTIQELSRSHALHIMVMEVMGIIIMEVMDIIIMEGMATTIMATIITMGTRVTMAMVEVMVMVMEGIITRATRVCPCRGILARFNAISVGRWATTPMLSREQEW